MTAATSSETTNKARKKSLFGIRYATSINSNRKCLIVNCVMQLLGLPVAAIIALIFCYIEENEAQMSWEVVETITNGMYAFAVIAVVAVGISVLLSIPIALIHFSYLHNKAKADMHYALPLNNKQRFLADYLSGLTVYLAPVIVAIILGFAILGIGSIFIETKMLWGEIVPFIFKMGIVVFLGMLQLYTISVFALTFCGNGFEAGFSICAFNVLIPSTIACLWFAITEKCTFGIVPESLLHMNIFTDTSPAGAAMFLLNFDDYFGLIVKNSDFDSIFAKWIIMNIICTAIYAVAAFFLYKSRKAEDVSKPYVHRSFFYALMTMAVFCVLSLFIIGEAPISAGIVVCAVGWFIMEIITRRGFKKFWTAAVSFVVATGAVFGILGICTVSDGFGATKRVPSADSVKNVVIYTSSSDFGSKTFTDEKVIGEAVKLHQECIDRYYNFDENDYPPVNADDNIFVTNDQYIELTYTTKSGAVFSRGYTVSQSMETELIKAIFLSDEAADFCTEDIGYRNEYADSKSPYFLSANRIGYGKTVTLSESEMEKFSSDLKADMNDMTEEELVNGDVYCYLENNMFVLKSFGRTVANLNNLGFDFSDTTIENNFAIMIDPVLASYSRLNYESRDMHGMVVSDYLGDLSEVDGLCNISPFNYDGYMENGIISEIDCQNPYIGKLIENMTNFALGEKPLAIISLDGYGDVYHLRDTEENRRLIENLMKYKVGDYDLATDEYEYDCEEVFYY